MYLCTVDEAESLDRKQVSQLFEETDDRSSASCSSREN